MWGLANAGFAIAAGCLQVAHCGRKAWLSLLNICDTFLGMFSVEV